MKAGRTSQCICDAYTQSATGEVNHGGVPVRSPTLDGRREGILGNLVGIYVSDSALIASRVTHHLHLPVTAELPEI